MKRETAARLALAFIIFLFAAALLGPLVSPYEFDSQDFARRFESPSSSHWLGTDEFGRDILVRLLHGARVSLGIGVSTAIISLILGTIAGGLAGYYGRWIDGALMKLANVVSTIPLILLATLITLVLGRSFTAILVSISAFAWILQARLVRGYVHSVKTRLHVEAARAIGAGDLRIFMHHILPELRGPLITSLGVLVPANILTESFLSFLGVGLQPPFASWGSLAHEGFRALESYPHLAIYPGASLFLTLFAMNFVAEWLTTQ